MKTTLSFQKILLVFFAFIGLLIAARWLFTGKPHFLFLAWNIFLAWIPFMISSRFEKTGHSNAWAQAGLFCLWLAFFPNALYIVTDLIHLDKQSNVPKWFDAVLLFSSSVVGLMMAFISLYRVEVFLKRRVHQKIHSVLIVIILFMGSFGVYLGRFLRWNSWDIVSNPLQLFVSIVERIITPFDHIQTWSVTIILTIFFYLLYISLKKLPGYISIERQDGFEPSDA